MVEERERLLDDQPVELTWKQLTEACRNIGFDLTCGACAGVFFTGYAMPHEGHSCPRSADQERERIAAWLDTFPWRGPGTLTLGEICQALRTNKLEPGPLAPPKDDDDGTP